MNSGAESWRDMDLVRRWVAAARDSATTLALNVLPRWNERDRIPAQGRRAVRSRGRSPVFWDCYQRVNYTDQLPGTRSASSAIVRPWVNGSPPHPGFGTSG